MDNRERCPICLEVFGQYQVCEFRGGVDACRHKLCFLCMMKYARDSRDSQESSSTTYFIKCPVCRKNYSGERLTDFFYIHTFGYVPGSCDNSQNIQKNK